MKTIRCLIAAIALAASFSIPPAWSASYSTDWSDLWWIPTESGWGIQLVQRNSIIFATMFVYDESGNPTWFVATMGASGMTWTGDLFATQGPWFGAIAFNPGAVRPTKVGSMTWSPTEANAGTLTYTVNGTQVTKQVQREFIDVDDFTGDYAGNLHVVTTGCSDPTQNGRNDLLAAMAIVQTGSTATVAIADENFNVCRFDGSLSQAGQMASYSGTFTCADGTQGSSSLDEMQVNPIGITARLTRHAAAGGCTTAGWFGGGRGDF